MIERISQKGMNDITTRTKFLWCSVVICLGSFLTGISEGTDLPQALAATTVAADSLGRPVAPDVTDDASLLLSRCGSPSLDDTTAYDKPRPLIPTRIIEYAKQGLRIAFVPRDSAVGDPPPYHWKLVGVMDMGALDPSKARVVPVGEAVARMPCWRGQ